MQIFFREVAMIRIIDFRTIIEKFDTHQKYYPKVVNFSTVDDYPLSTPPSARITVVPASNLNSAETVSHVEFDDIIRLQVSIRYSIREKHIWIDLFEGRIQNQSKEFGSNNQISFDCVGHLYEAFYALLTQNSTFTSADARTILISLAETNTNLGRITSSTDYMTTGLVIPSYEVTGGQIYMSDAYMEMEKISGYSRFVDTRTVYTSTGNYNTSYLLWNPLSSTPTKKYKIIENTPRLLSATFEVVGEDVRTLHFVRGATDVNGNQYVASYADSGAVTLYGNRYSNSVFSWVKSNAQCQSIAQGLTADTKLPYVTGNVVLEGTPDAHKGDLVTVKIPSLEVNGVEINGNYSVYRVRHDFNGQQYTTSLDIGRIKKTEYDYLNRKIVSIVQTAYKNQIKV